MVDDNSGELPDELQKALGKQARVANIEIGVDWEKQMVTFIQKHEGPIITEPLMMAMHIDSFMATAHRLGQEIYERKQKLRQVGIVGVPSRGPRRG